MPVNWGAQQFQPQTQLNVQPGIQNYFRAQENQRQKQIQNSLMMKAQEEKKKKAFINNLIQDSQKITKTGTTLDKQQFVSRLYQGGYGQDAMQYEQHFAQEESKRQQDFMTKQKMLLQAKGDIWTQNEPYLRAITDPKERANLLKDSYKEWNMDASRLPDDIDNEMLEDLAESFKPQFAPNRLQSRINENLEYMNFNPATGTYEIAKDAAGNPIKAPQSYAIKEGEGGFTQIPTKQAVTTAPAPITGITPAGKKKRKLDEQRGALAIKQADLALKQADINFSKAEKLASQGGQFAAAQYKTAGYGLRMVQAEKALEKLQASGYDPASISTSVAKNSPELLKDSNVKLYLQAQRNFINATLRPESGAAIAESEFENAEKQYFPQLGDTDEVKAQKRQNRLAKQAEMQAESGGAWGEVLQKYESLNAQKPITQSPLGKKASKKSESFRKKYKY